MIFFIICQKTIISVKNIIMYKNKKVVVVLPAYNAALTLKKTYEEIPFDLVDEVILCDDASKDNTVELAKEIGIQHIIKHEKNKGYGGNQKSLYNKALELGGDIIIMLHPDYQYTPLLIPSMVNIIGEDLYPVSYTHLDVYKRQVQIAL